MVDKNLIYEEDFNLGDLVTIQNSKWDVTVDGRITELTEYMRAVVLGLM